MSNLDKIFQKQSIIDFEAYMKTNSLKSDETYLILALSDVIRANGNNDFFSHVFNFVNINYNNETTTNSLLELAIDYSDRDKYDIIKNTINDQNFYKRYPCNIYCLYKPEFINEFKPTLEVKDNKFDNLLVFVLNHTKEVYPEAINAIIERATPEQLNKLLGEAIANSIIFNHPQGMHFFLEKSEELDCWNQVQIYLEGGLKQKGPANLRYEPKYKDCEDLNLLLEYLKESKYEGAQYYQDTISRFNFYCKLDDKLDSKPQNKKMKI
jgi:hypothetical protein